MNLIKLGQLTTLICTATSHLSGMARNTFYCKITLVWPTKVQLSVLLSAIIHEMGGSPQRGAGSRWEAYIS